MSAVFFHSFCPQNTSNHLPLFSQLPGIRAYWVKSKTWRQRDAVSLFDPILIDPRGNGGTPKQKKDDSSAEPPTHRILSEIGGGKVVDLAPPHSLPDWGGIQGIPLFEA